MEAGTAGDDVGGLGLLENFRRGRAKCRIQYLTGRNPFGEGIGDRVRLLVDFFQHVMAIFATLHRIEPERLGSDRCST